MKSQETIEIFTDLSREGRESAEFGSLLRLRSMLNCYEGKICEFFCTSEHVTIVGRGHIGTRTSALFNIVKL